MSSRKVNLGAGRATWSIYWLILKESGWLKAISVVAEMVPWVGCGTLVPVAQCWQLAHSLRAICRLDVLPVNPTEAPRAE